MCFGLYLFPWATSQAAMPAWIFGDCHKGQILRCFAALQKSRSRKAGGIGLGLALCSRIAALHNASLYIESREGEGTRVAVVFQEEA